MEIPGEGPTRGHGDCEAEEILDNMEALHVEPRLRGRKETLSKLSAFYANARSIVNIDKRMELELYVDKEQPDIIGITESWAKESIQDSELELEGYMVFRKDLKNWGERGYVGVGLSLYIKDNLTTLER